MSSKGGRLGLAVVGALVTLAVLAGAGLLVGVQGGPPEATVHFIDVGQGDAILLQTPGCTLLVDGGPAPPGVIAYLQRLGVRRLDLMVASHAHADHIGGLVEVLHRLPVAEVWYNGQVHTTRTFERFIDAIEASGARYHEPVRGEVRACGELTIEVLHPKTSMAESSGHLHAGMIVLRVLHREVAVLLTGDAERDVERALLAAGADLSAQILKVGHHGSRTSSSQAFVRAVNPEIAVYQAGRDNRYGHPHQETLDTFARLGIPLYGTDRHGTVRIALTPYGYAVHRERDPEEVKRVAGIGAARFQEMRGQICVEGL